MMLHVQFRCDPRRRQVLEAIAVRDGLSVSEVLRRAVDALITAENLRPADGWPVAEAAGAPLPDRWVVARPPSAETDPWDHIA